MTPIKEKIMYEGFLSDGACGHLDNHTLVAINWLLVFGLLFIGVATFSQTLVRGRCPLLFVLTFTVMLDFTAVGNSLLNNGTKSISVLIGHPKCLNYQHIYLCINIELPPNSVDKFVGELRILASSPRLS